MPGTDSSNVASDRLPEGGETGALLRTIDWSSTSLGRRESWPENLRLAVEVCFNSRFPMMVLWGPHLVQIYNDDYRELMGAKHPAAMAQPTRECWPELWYLNVSVYEAVFRGQVRYFVDKFHRVIRNGVPEDANFTISYGPILDDDGTVGGILVTAHETTLQVALRTSQVALRASRELAERQAAELEAIIESMPDAVYFGTTEGMTRCNAESLAMFGASSLADLQEHIGTLGATFSARWADSGRPLAAEDSPFARALAGEATTQELIMRRNDTGEELFIRAAAAPIVQGGRIVGAVGINADISEQRRMEAVLRERDEHLQLAADASDLGVWQWELTTGAITSSASYRRHFGVTEELTLERVLGELIHPDDRERVRAALDNALSKRVIYDEEYRVTWPDGSIHWIGARGRALGGTDGQPRRMIGVSLDITARRRAQHNLQQAQRMEAVGQLAAGIAHDLNNMLVVILAHCDFLRQDLAPDDPGRDDVQQITGAANRSSALTRQLLTFARRDVVQLTDLDLNEVILQTERLLRPALGEGIRVVLDLAAETLLVSADRGQIEQIVLNLAFNARDAMRLGGRLTISTRTIRVGRAYNERHPGTEIAAGRYVRLTVTDTGTGMPPATLARVFEPFFTTKPAGHGTGLGLSMIYGAIKQAGGFVWADSVEGFGSTFEIILPAVPERTETGGEDVPHSRTYAGTETILIVAESEQIRRLACLALEGRGYRCLEAHNADEALVVLHGHAALVHLVLTDLTGLTMPELDGHGQAEKFRGLRPALPVLYTSAVSEEEVRRRGLLVEGRPFLPMPFTSEGVVQAVRQLLDESPSGSP